MCVCVYFHFSTYQSTSLVHHLPCYLSTTFLTICQFVIVINLLRFLSLMMENQLVIIVVHVLSPVSPYLFKKVLLKLGKILIFMFCSLSVCYKNMCKPKDFLISVIVYVQRPTRVF